MATTTRTRSPGPTKRTPRAKSTTASTPSLSASTRSRVAAAGSDAKATVRRLSNSTTKAIKSVPVNKTTVSIAAGALTAAALAGIAAFLGRERLVKAAATSRDVLKQTADDLSTVAHEKIDLARDNITKLRARVSSAPTQASEPSEDIPIAM